jgi:hypothetical protein
MPPNRVQQRAATCAPTPVRGSRRIVRLTRVTHKAGAETRTLHFTFEGGQRRAARARVSFIDKDCVPEFTGDQAWFEVEELRGHPWNYWVALRQVEPPADA